MRNHGIAVGRDPAITSKIMAAVRSKDTKPERTLRRALFARGLRYRLHDKHLAGRPDIVFGSSRVVVFVDGDFWHGGGWQARGLSRLEDQFPTNRDFWVGKILRNVARDREVDRILVEAGWQVVRVWESEINADIADRAAFVARVVEQRRDRNASSQPQAPGVHGAET